MCVCLVHVHVLFCTHTLTHTHTHTMYTYVSNSPLFSLSLSSWSPYGAVVVALNPAKYQLNDSLVEVPGGGALLRTARWVEGIVEGPLSYEVYPNRDSLLYRDLYGISEAHTVITFYMYNYHGSVQYKVQYTVQCVYRNLENFHSHIFFVHFIFINVTRVNIATTQFINFISVKFNVYFTDILLLRMIPELLY